MAATAESKIYVVVTTAGYIPDVILVTHDKDKALAKGEDYAGEWDNVIEDEGSLYFNQAEEGNLDESVSVFEVTLEL